MPIVLEIDRNKVVADILSQTCENPHNLMIKFDRPYTVGLMRASLEGDEYVGMGVAKVCHPDIWNEKKGKSLVIIRAARQIADEFVAELKRIEKEANATAMDIGMAVMSAMDSDESLEDMTMHDLMDRLLKYGDEEEE